MLQSIQKTEYPCHIVRELFRDEFIEYTIEPFISQVDFTVLKQLPKSWINHLFNNDILKIKNNINLVTNISFAS